MASFGSIKSAVWEREERKRQYQSHICGLNAYDRHKKFMRDYVHFYGNRKTTDRNAVPSTTDLDTVREGYRFIRSAEDDDNPSWEQKLVKRYHDKLFKEDFALRTCHNTGMERYTKICLEPVVFWSGSCGALVSCIKLPSLILVQIGLRWRTEKEVMLGKGQFICGNKKCDKAKDGLASYEVNFSYTEAGTNKQALVKLVACDRCAEKLMYKHNKEKILRKGIEEKAKHKRKRDKTIGDLTDGSDGSHRRQRKGGNESTSRTNPEKYDEDDSFDEYLDGMFPEERQGP